jgi:hypothetical protein
MQSVMTAEVCGWRRPGPVSGGSKPGKYARGSEAGKSGSMRGELATTKMRLLVPHVAFVVNSQHHGASAQRQESHASRSH